jgi:hypothetical protein
VALYRHSKGNTLPRKEIKAMTRLEILELAKIGAYECWKEETDSEEKMKFEQQYNEIQKMINEERQKNQ